MSEHPAGPRLLDEAVVVSTESDRERPFDGSDHAVAELVEKVLTIWQGGVRDDPGSPMSIEFDMADPS